VIDHAAIVRELTSAKAHFQLRALAAAMGIDPDSVRVVTDDNSVAAAIDTQSAPGSYTDALASPSCFITVLSGASETCPHISDTAGGADYDASRHFCVLRPPMWAGQFFSFHGSGYGE
jgi:hypothetical protein